MRQLLTYCILIPALLEFKTILGPLGIGEFNELKSKNALWKDDIFEYIDSLNEKHIITEEQQKGFKNRISNIFGEKKEIINVKEDTVNRDIRR